MPPGTVDFVNFNELRPFLPGTTLGAANIDFSLVKASVQSPFHLAPSASLAFGVSAGTDLTVRAINQRTGDDDDHVVAPAAPLGSPKVELPAQIEQTDRHAWLKYRVQGDVSATASGGAGWFGAEGSARKSVACAFYRRHAGDEMVLAAVAEDVRERPKLALLLSDVQALGDGDAVSVQVAGDITASVTLTFADIFSSQIGTLTRVISSSAPIGISISAGAKVTTSVSLSDAFLLVFSRIGDQWRVGLKKGTVRTVDFGVEPGVSVQIENPEEVTSLLNGIVGNLLGKGFEELQALAAKNGFDEADVSRYADVFKRLGLRSTPGMPEYQAALDRVQEQVRKRLETLVREKVALAFRYEYQRITSDATLFRALLTKEALDEHHGSLIRGSLNGVLAAATAQPSGPITVETYLNEKTVKTTHAYGFTLGTSKWKASGQDRSELVAIRRRSFDDHEQRSYAGLGAYTGSVFGETKSWQTDFAAAMPRFSVGKVPGINEYELGLSLVYEETDRKFDAEDLEQAVDFAVLWSICSAATAADVREMLRPALGKGQVEWSAHVRVNDEAFRAVLPVIASKSRGQFAGPMAAALRSNGKLGIRDVARRRVVYEPVWAFYLDEIEQPAPRDVATVAVKRLRGQEPGASSLEQQFLAGGGADRLLTAGGTCELNAGTRASVDDFIRAARLLSGACQRNNPDLGLLTTAYKQMRKLWTQSHHVRALGSRLVDAATEAGALKGIERTLTLVAGSTSLTVSSNQPGTL